MCLDINVGDVQTPLVMSACHQWGGNQFFAITETQMIVTNQDFCVGANDQHYAVISVDCIDPSQSWTFDKEVCCLLLFEEEMEDIFHSISVGLF